jgi:hypothetical protein
MRELDRTREITSHKCSDLNENINVFSTDDSGPGGAHHKYNIIVVDRLSPQNGFSVIKFQKGAVKDVGINGISDEALLAIVEDRLECFQAGPFACSPNEGALNHIRAAMDELKTRTRDRIERGVEGHSKK